MSARINKTSLVESVAAILRERIITGEVAPGEPLIIENVARELDVSRTPVREALAKLESAGLIDRKAGHVPTVFKPTRENALEYYEMRIALEPLAGRLATPRVDGELIARLQEIVAEMEQYDDARFFGLNRSFHETIYARSCRPYLQQVIHGLIDRSDPYIRVYFSEHDAQETQRGHREILEAVTARDPDAVADTIRRHLADVVSGILGSLDEDG